MAAEVVTVKARSWAEDAVAGRAHSRAAALLVVCGAVWPVGRWWLARLGDGGEAAWGLVALAAAVGLTPRERWGERLPRATAVGGALGLALFAVLGGIVPPLVRAGVALGVVALVLGGGRGWAGRVALLGLALPGMETGQFFAGYPLRVVAAEVSRLGLGLAGVEVSRVGTTLGWAGELVVVDAPCSGVRMLWTALVLAAALAAVRGNGPGATLGRLVAAAGVVVVANGLRAALVFPLEVGWWSGGAWAHAAVGLGVFSAVVAAVLVFSGTDAGDGKRGVVGYAPRGAGPAGASPIAGGAT